MSDVVIEKSKYHKRTCCADCGYWQRPFGYPGGPFYNFFGNGFDVCPKCGSENLTTKVGRVVSERTVERVFALLPFPRYREIKHLDFEIRPDAK